MELLIDQEQQNSEHQASHVMVTVEPGTWWRRKDESETVRLLSDIKLHLGEVHTVVLLNPPNTHKFDTKFLFKDFIAHFEQVSEEEALSVRNQEVQAIQNEIHKISTDLSNQALLESIALERVSEAHKKLEFNSDSASTGETLPAAQKNNQLAMQKLMIQAKASEELSNVISEHTSLIAEKSRKIAEYASERGQLAEAKTKLIQKGIGTIQTKVETLQVYAGEGVFIEQVLEGEVADKSHKVHLMQRKLYMDEESLINCLNGGADHNDIHAFLDSLKEDKELLNRMMPHQKCVVAMQYRRNRKDYGKDVGAFESANENFQNKSAFLMIRNGENLYVVFSKVDRFENLFISPNEMNNCFINWGERVTLNSTSFVDSMEALDSRFETYKRIHLLLTGLYERQPEIFSPLSGENGSVVNLLNYADMNDSFEFVFDVQNAIASNQYPPVEEWFKRAHDIKIGSRVLFYPSTYITIWGGGDSKCKERAPSMFSYSHRWNYYNNLMNLDVEYILQNEFVVEEEKGKLFIRVPATRSGSESNGWEEKDVLLKIFIDDDVLEGAETNSFFCLDSILPEEILYYAYSREARKLYLEYAHMIKKALKHTQEAEKALLPIIKDIQNQLNLTDLDVKYNTLWLAVSKWRIANKGVMPPKVDQDSSYLDFVEWIATFLFHKKEDRTEDILSLCRDSDLTPVIIKHGKAWSVFREMTEEEAQDTAPFYGRYLVKQAVILNKNSIKLGTPSFVLPERISAKDETTWEDKALFKFWKESKTNMWMINHPVKNVQIDSIFGGKFIDTLSHVQLKRSIEHIRAGQEKMSKNISFLESVDTHKLFYDWRQRWRYTQSGYLTSHDVFIPVAYNNEGQVLGIKCSEELFLYWQMPPETAFIMVETIKKHSGPNYDLRTILNKAIQAGINEATSQEFIEFALKHESNVLSSLGTQMYFEELRNEKKYVSNGVLMARYISENTPDGDDDKTIIENALGFLLKN